MKLDKSTMKFEKSDIQNELIKIFTKHQSPKIRWTDELIEKYKAVYFKQFKLSLISHIGRGDNAFELGAIDLYSVDSSIVDSSISTNLNTDAFEYMYPLLKKDFQKSGIPYSKKIFGYPAFIFKISKLKKYCDFEKLGVLV